MQPPIGILQICNRLVQSEVSKCGILYGVWDCEVVMVMMRLERKRVFNKILSR